MLPCPNVACRFLHDLLVVHVQRSKERSEALGHHLWDQSGIGVGELMPMALNFVDEMEKMHSAVTAAPGGL